MTAHEIQQPIREIDIFTDANSDPLSYRVGRKDVTHIEACTKPGLHCDIPYVRVWKGDVCEAEFCQHNIIGVYFDQAVPPPNEDDVARWKAMGVSNIQNGKCTTCEKSDVDCDCVPF